MRNLLISIVLILVGLGWIFYVLTTYPANDSTTTGYAMLGGLLIILGLFGILVQWLSSEHEKHGDLQ